MLTDKESQLELELELTLIDIKNFLERYPEKREELKKRIEEIIK